MVTTAEIPILQKYAGMTASNKSPDLPTNGHIENGVGRRSIARSYQESSDRERKRRKVIKGKEIVMGEMTQTSEVLSPDHPMYAVVNKICYRLKPEAEPEVTLSLSDSLKAFTIQDKKTIVLSAGLLRDLEDFLVSKDKQITEDHIALILGHEMSHWDPEASKPHIGERYCDVKGLEMVNKAGYNVDAAVEALEFLDAHEEQAKQGYNQPEEGQTTISSAEASHPTSENRRILIQSLANDPNAYLEGRYAKPTPFDNEVYGDFKKRADEWLQIARDREMIASEEDIQREFGRAQSLSQNIETFLSADEYYHARMSREFAQTQEFSNLVLAMAVFAEVTDQDFNLLNKEDFQAQFRAGLIQTGVVSETDASTAQNLQTPQFTTQKTISPDQIQLIQDCLNGRFEDPLAILTSSQEDLQTNHPEFANFKFNNFFKGITDDVNFYIHPQFKYGRSGVEEARNLDRAKILGYQGEFEQRAFIADEAGGLTSEISQERSLLMSNLRFAFSSSILRFSQMDPEQMLDPRYTSHWDGYTHEARGWTELMPVASIMVSDMQRFGPDYAQMQRQIAESLISSGSCQTQDVATLLSSILLEGGRYLEQAHHNWNLLGGQRPPKTLRQVNPSVHGNIGTEETRADLRDSLLDTHISLTQGGSELGSMFTRPRIDAIEERFNGLFLNLDHQTLSGTVLDQYQILISGGTTLSIPSESMMLDHWRRAFSLEGIDFVTTKFYEYDSVYGDRFICWETDPEIIKSLILESTSGLAGSTRTNRRIKIIDAILANEQNKANLPLMRKILEEGVVNQLLTQGEIERILEGVDNLSLYRDFHGYLEENKQRGYYRREFEQFKSEQEAYGVGLPEIIARFIESGNVVQIGASGSGADGFGAMAYHDAASGDWFSVIPEQRFGENWYSNSGQPYPEHPDFSFTQARELADRIVVYTQRENFPHSEDVKAELLYSASALVRYSERLNNLIRSNRDVREVSYLGEGLTSLDELTDRISNMPEGKYRDDCLDTAVLMVFNPNFLANNTVSFEQVQRLFSMFSASKLQDLDPESNSSRDVSSRQTNPLPLTKGSFDIREMYPFKYTHEESFFIDAFSKYADMLDDQVLLIDPSGLFAKLDQAIAAIPHPSSVRDYLIERALFPLVNNDEGFAQVDTKERLAIFTKAYEVAHSARTKGSLGRSIAEIKLEQMDTNLNFDDGVRVILETMPERSTNRDQLILRVLNSTYTTWSQIGRAEALLLGNDYQTEEKAAATRSIIQEVIYRKVQDMSTNEREELVFFLLDTSKHITKPDELTEKFFDEVVAEKLKQAIVGTYELYSPLNSRRMSLVTSYTKISDPSRAYQPFEFSEATYDRFEFGIREYLIRRLRGEDVSQVRDSIKKGVGDWRETSNILGVLDQVELPEILNLSIPKSVNELIQGQLGSRERTVSGTSLGPMFVTLSPEDRRQLIYRLALGQRGFFEDRLFENHGRKILEEFVGLSTRTGGSGWTEQEIVTTSKVLGEAFGSLAPGRRTEVFSRIVNLIIASGGELNKEQVMKTMLTAFGVVGAKVGQMDQLLPEYLRDELGSLKEQVPALPKTTIAQVMRKSGRDSYYEGLGPIINAASTATVCLGKRLGQTEMDSVIKVLRPDALKSVDSDLEAVKAIVTTLNEEGVLEVDPTQIIEELKTMIAEEFDPRNEKRNVEEIKRGRGKPMIRKRVMDVFRVKPGQVVAGVKVPEVDFAGDAHLEMSKAMGVSLSRIEELKARKAKGETLLEQEQIYADMDLTAVHQAVVADFFHQTFASGVFHTDLHQGNIFVDPEGNVTEIDHGQVGRELSPTKRRALVEFTIGLAKNESRLIAKALSQFAPQVEPSEISGYLTSQMTTSNILTAATRLVSQYNINGSINRFTKAMVNIYPYMSQLNEEALQQVMLPYLADPIVIFDLEKTVPGMITEPIREVVRTKLSPVIDEAIRLDRVRQDPAMKEALEATLKTSVGGASIGADIAYLLGKGETIVEMPVPRSLRPVWKIVGLLSGRDKQGREALNMH